MLRDRGYFGVPAKSIDFTMKRRTTEYPLGETDKERNRHPWCIVIITVIFTSDRLKETKDKLKVE